MEAAALRLLLFCRILVHKALLQYKVWRMNYREKMMCFQNIVQGRNTSKRQTARPQSQNRQQLIKRTR